MIPDFLHLTKSQEKLIRDWLADLAMEENHPFEDCCEKIISGIEFPEKASRKEKGELFFHKVRQLRLPLLTAAEDRFKARVNDFFKNNPALKKQIRIKHSGYFEDEEIRVELLLTPEILDKVLDYLSLNREILKDCIL